jgi:hypothetical protein
MGIYWLDYSVSHRIESGGERGVCVFQVFCYKARMASGLHSACFLCTVSMAFLLNMI